VGTSIGFSSICVNPAFWSWVTMIWAESMWTESVVESNTIFVAPGFTPASARRRLPLAGSWDHVP
jgi:hypothetical protein